jgi:hypothetical protein
MNPIYIQYYSHEGTDCYKIDLPYTPYRKDTRVLCRVDEGLELAKERAEVALYDNIKEALNEEII